jgi:hypothetical protein
VVNASVKEFRFLGSDTVPAITKADYQCLIPENRRKLLMISGMWVWSNGSRKILFRKGTLGFDLRDIFIRWRYLSLGSPDIWVNGSEATAYVAMSVDGSGSRSIFRLVNRDGRWLILEWEFWLI